MPLPSGLGLEASGVVLAVGDGVSEVKVGDKVAYAGGPPGAYSSQRIIPAHRLVKVPAKIPHDIAAAMMLKGLTVWYLIKKVYQVQRGETVLFHAAAGGVGLIACQWLKSLGVKVIGTVGSDEKAKLAKKWDWLHKDFILSMLTSDPTSHISAYKHFVSMDESEELLGLLDNPKWPPFLGGKQFLNWVKKAFFESKREKEVPDSIHLAPDLSQIKAMVCDYYRIHESILHRTQRGVRNEPRDVAIYLARMLRQEELQSIGKNFGLSNYSSVSTVVDRVKSQIDKDRKFRSQVEEIKHSIQISQPKT